MVIGVTVFVTLVTGFVAVAVARAPYRAMVCKEESKARVRDAVLNGRITADEANIIINDEKLPMLGQSASRTERKAKSARDQFFRRRRLGRLAARISRG